MKRIWAPWRIEYVNGEHQGKGCIFCAAGRAKDEFSKLVVDKDNRALVMLNKFPYIGGHLLVAPKRHVGELDALTEEESLALFHMTNRSVAALKRAMKPHGFNIGINLGKVAGAGVPEHIHIHVVPRWNGDTNFVPVLGQTRIINEHLERTWQKLRDNWKLEE